MPSADAHMHLFAEGFGGVSGASPAGGDETVVYERLRRYHGIERSLVLGYEGESRYAGNSDFVLSQARTRTWIAPLAYLPVSPAPAPLTLRALREPRRPRLRALPREPVRGPGAERMACCGAFAEVRRQRALVSINAAPETTAQMARIGEDLDGCTVLFSHLGSPRRFPRPPRLYAAREHLAPLLVLAARGNINVKFSGLYAVSAPDHDFPHYAAKPFVDVVLEAFGPSRLLWGSDFPPALDFVSFAQLADSRLLSGCTPRRDRRP